MLNLREYLTPVVALLLFQDDSDGRYFRSCLSGHRRLERIFLDRLHLYLCSDTGDKSAAEPSPDSDTDATVGSSSQTLSLIDVDGREGSCCRVLLGCDLQAATVKVKATGGLHRKNTFFGGTSAFITNANASFIPHYIRTYRVLLHPSSLPLSALSAFDWHLTMFVVKIPRRSLGPLTTRCLMRIT